MSSVGEKSKSSLTWAVQYLSRSGIRSTICFGGRHIIIIVRGWKLHVYQARLRAHSLLALRFSSLAYNSSFFFFTSFFSFDRFNLSVSTLGLASLWHVFNERQQRYGSRSSPRRAHEKPRSVASNLQSCMRLNQPGQEWELHSCVSLRTPRQSFPPWKGPLHVLFRHWPPPPHVKVHSLHSDQSPNTPSTVSRTLQCNHIPQTWKLLTPFLLCNSTRHFHCQTNLILYYYFRNMYS